MWKTSFWALLFTGLSVLTAQTPSAPPVPEAPVLMPGEGLAVAGPDGVVQTYGEATREVPMGSLAKLVWMRLEGDEWAALGVEFKCTGEWNGHHCWLAKGHGRVDLGKALQESCNLAFLAWVQMSAERWKHYYGEGVARVRLDEVFGPFVGNRMKAGDGLPAFGPEWIGDGDLLRTSPETMLKWMLDPHQEEAMARCRRHLLGFVGSMIKNQSWWAKTGTAPVPGVPGETCAWVAGSNEFVTCVLRLPRGKGRSDGLARFRTLMKIPDKK
ncbi:MAG: hypothetical protein WAT51_10455 [Holophaga sp.]